MPFSLLEALAHGCPVVASNIGGLPEIIKIGYNGWLCQPGEVKSLVQALNLAQEADPILMGQQARESVRGYGWDYHLKAIKAIYQEIVGSKV